MSSSDDFQEGLPDELIQWHRLVMKSSPIAAAITEGKSHIIRDVNPAFDSLMQQEQGQLNASSFLDSLPANEKTRGLELLNRVYRTGNPENLIDVVHKTVDGLPQLWSYTIWSMVDKKRGSIGLNIQVTDTTEAANLREDYANTAKQMLEVNQALLISGLREQEMAELAAAAHEQLLQAQKMEGLGRLAGGIAHDFNNLLTAILGFTELAKDNVASDIIVHGFLNNIKIAADRAATLTAQLLTFARKQVVESRAVNTHSVILDIEKILLRLVTENIELEIVSTSDLGLVKMDAGQLGQVLINLIVNARDAMPEGGKIKISTSNISLASDYVDQHVNVTSGDYVLLSVSDTGSGMSEEVMDHIFEPFYTTKARGKGTGLGLATCYGIIEQGGGHISVTSKPNIGTDFHIYLPRVYQNAEIVIKEDSSLLTTGQEVILLVEDEPMVLEIGARTLSSLGYTVLTAGNGAEALNLIQEYAGEIDLLLTDVVMPQMGGRELASCVRTIRPNVKVIFTSGYTDDLILNQQIMQSGLPFLQKPFTPTSLGIMVRETLDSED